jgi:hypothetical protein
MRWDPAADVRLGARLKQPSTDQVAIRILRRAEGERVRCAAKREQVDARPFTSRCHVGCSVRAPGSRAVAWRTRYDPTRNWPQLQWAFTLCFSDGLILVASDKVRGGAGEVRLDNNIDTASSAANSAANAASTLEAGMTTLTTIRLFRASIAAAASGPVADSTAFSLMSWASQPCGTAR